MLHLGIEIGSRGVQLCGISVGLMLWLAGCAAQPSSVSLDLSDDEVMVATILDWWDGDYNNDKQIAELSANGAPIWQQGAGEEEGMGGHLPANSYYRPINLPAFGGQVLYLEEFTFRSDPYRQRIYTVSKDDPTNTVRVKLWYFKDKEKYAGAWQDLSRLNDLLPEDMTSLPSNCDLVASPTNDGRIYMRMPENECKFGNRLFDYQVILGADDFWFRDQIVDTEDMRVIVSAGGFTYHKMDKVN